jgi:hypothetical protein
MTRELLKIYEFDEKTDSSYFSKTFWYKMLKILAHLIHLQDIMTSTKERDNIFSFILTAFEKTNESLSFLYFMRVVMLLTKKGDNNLLFR